MILPEGIRLLRLRSNDIDSSGWATIERAMKALVTLEIPFIVEVDEWGNANVKRNGIEERLAARNQERKS